MSRILSLSCLVLWGLVGAPPSARAEGARSGPSQAATILAAAQVTRPDLRSASAMVVDRSGRVLLAKHADEPRPIASITKLMTAMVLIDAGLPPDAVVEIRDQDRDRLRYSRSRLPVGASLTRTELLRLALIASENRAAQALARGYPGGTRALVLAMNRKAAALGMHATRLADPTGLDAENVSTARDLTTLLRAAYAYPEIRSITTTASYPVDLPGQAEPRVFRNTNLLVRRHSRHWSIGLSKTGYLTEAGRCLVMQAEVAHRPLFIVLLSSWGKYTPIGDSNRIRKWLEAQPRSARRASG